MIGIYSYIILYGIMDFEKPIRVRCLKESPRRDVGSHLLRLRTVCAVFQAAVMSLLKSSISPQHPFLVTFRDPLQRRRHPLRLFHSSFFSERPRKKREKKDREILQCPQQMLKREEDSARRRDLLAPPGPERKAWESSLVGISSIVVNTRISCRLHYKLRMCYTHFLLLGFL